ncbi:3-phenylpropionate/cinnamic acid dioxygenase subunit beta [Nitrincola tapanii]|uniref:3-phenylpropionate/cinnamic acid dioxygenase subunit beta n=1 Tax=Nitrincola tapanii TaxID=1708751 RepID=A0A5A9VZR1_9GAMM|nr:3-phenylpropionate/cinnamic acid dioxygenase subunit beta [Nitrincola tapanii]KAA0873987.1 3-phenylpropionate/cinnamic acid dioxygenase subunit beta [Nitrincola tapanii]
MFTKTPDLPIASMEELFELSAFLHKEARLLDEERFEEWLEMLHEEIHYWMPGIENRRRENPLKEGFYDKDHMAYFDDRMRDLQRRVARFRQPSAWAENPATRNVHIISNVEAFIAPEADTYMVCSTFTSIRSRGLDEEYVIYGRRYDRIQRTEGGLKLLKRLILIPNATLSCKNINTFL